MGKSVSYDIRLRMVRGIAAGKSRRAVAAQFEVAPSTAVRVQARFAATGSVDPAKQGRPKGSGKLGPYQEAVLDKVKAQPDITMPDLAAWLEAVHGVTADPSNLSKFLCQHGFTYKKACPREGGERCWHRKKNALTSGRPAGCGATVASLSAPSTGAARLHR